MSSNGIPSYTPGGADVPTPRADRTRQRAEPLQPAAVRLRAAVRPDLRLPFRRPGPAPHLPRHCPRQRREQGGILPGQGPCLLPENCVKLARAKAKFPGEFKSPRSIQ